MAKDESGSSKATAGGVDATPGQVNDNVAGHPEGFPVNRTNLPSKQNQNRPGAVNNDVAGHPAGFPVQSTVPGPLESGTSEKTVKGDYNTKDPNFNKEDKNVSDDKKKEDGSWWNQKGPQDEKVQSAEAKKAQDKGEVKPSAKTAQAKEAEKGADHEEGHHHDEHHHHHKDKDGKECDKDNCPNEDKGVKSEKKEDKKEDKKSEKKDDKKAEGKKDEKKERAKKAKEDVRKVEDERKKKNPGLFAQKEEGVPVDQPRREERLECEVPKDLPETAEEAYRAGHEAGLKKADHSKVEVPAHLVGSDNVEAAFRAGHDDAIRSVEGEDAIPFEAPHDEMGHELDSEGRVRCEIHPQALISPNQECPECNADRLGGHTARATAQPKFHTDAAGQLEGLSNTADNRAGQAEGHHAN